ncbi:DUF2806 domain-containing protein [Aeromonas veronii]|uniref:DUF2806 domain-containing protein n=1 Tax=Aeromonas veronii TaxID=654 RepID=UPI002417D48B|nr:DUF2806 domain-containing protein [Aeromonas veronii]WFO51380.1 DUF2806 domain-containing protein [Aeromonas veronii]
MSDGNSVINFGDLSKPATVLIEKISGAIGVIYEPTKIKRMAKAEVEANKIRVLGDIEISEVQQRALSRFVHEEGKKQENIESITYQATAFLDNSADPMAVDNDWISYFFEKCRNISDAEIQVVWARILAGESNNPGSFSKKTIEIISTLDKSDANLFTTLCSFSVRGRSEFVLVLDYNDEFYKNHGITFPSLNDLEAIGLVKFNSSQNLALLRQPKIVFLNYFDIPIRFTLAQEHNNNLDIGAIILTRAGEELAPICGAKMNPEFLDYLKGFYHKKGIKLDIMYPSV